MTTSEILLKNIINYANSLHELANTQFPIVMEIKKIEIPSDFKKYPKYYFGNYDNEYTPSTMGQIELQLNQIIQKIDDFISDIKLIHSQNEIAIENNKKVVKAIQTMMSNYGIDKEYTCYSGKIRITKSSGYIEDVNRVIITTDEYNIVMNEIDNIKKNIIDVANSHKRAIKAKIEEVKFKEYQEYLTYLSVKYNMGRICDKHELITHIIKQCFVFRLYIDYKCDGYLNLDDYALQSDLENLFINVTNDELENVIVNYLKMNYDSFYVDLLKLLEY